MTFRYQIAPALTKAAGASGRCCAGPARQHWPHDRYQAIFVVVCVIDAPVQVVHRRAQIAHGVVREAFAITHRIPRLRHRGLRETVFPLLRAQMPVRILRAHELAGQIVVVRGERGHLNLRPVLQVTITVDSRLGVRKPIVSYDEFQTHIPALFLRGNTAAFIDGWYGSTAAASDLAAEHQIPDRK
ncbi:hypothetical protein QF000_001356 [Paraburkholderia atlantica]|uniref:hypothetical protein n=1 Tax=Paraburkholderia atlantica TaxID=2654982 RepID=UPI003D1E09B4